MRGYCLGSPPLMRSPLSLLPPLVHRVRRLDFDVCVLDAAEMSLLRTIVLNALHADSPITDLTLRLRCRNHETAQGLGGLGRDLGIQSMRNPPTQPRQVRMDLQDNVLLAVTIEPLWHGLITLPEVQGLRFRVDGSCVGDALRYQHQPTMRGLRWLHLGVSSTQLTSRAFRHICRTSLNLPRLHTLRVDAAHNELADDVLPDGPGDPGWTPQFPDVLRAAVFDLRDNRFSAGAPAALAGFVDARPVFHFHVGDAAG